jgi:3-deoxy-manno-octulosonate cytidylyltransferase (CMP-KDO synthetase)
MNPIVVIPSRLEASRFPNKPLALIAGEPMILHVWRRAVASNVGPVVVACSSEVIKKVIEDVGGTAILTDPNHPSGSDRIYEALSTIDPYKEHDFVVNIQGDMPTLDPQIIQESLKAFTLCPTFDMTTLAAKITKEEEKANSNIVKAIISFNVHSTLGKALYFTRCTAPWGEGPLYHHIGLYTYRRPALEKFVSLPPSPLEKREKLEQLRALEAGIEIGVQIADTVPLGVDVPSDVQKAEELLSA